MPCQYHAESVPSIVSRPEQTSGTLLQVRRPRRRGPPLSVWTSDTLSEVKVLGTSC